jgi:hypothetical protein
MTLVILTRVADATTNATDENSPALKEWAVIVHALLEGEQIIDLRKGGLHEPGRHFGLPARRFWLSPTSEHQKAELVKPAYQHWLGLAASSPAGGPVAVHGWAEVTDVATITEPEHLEALESKSIWTSEYVSSRFSWKRRDPLWVLVLRVHRLAEPRTIDWRESYGGCTSWVSYADLPDDPATLPSEVALSDVAFEGKRKGVREALPADCWDA